MTGLASEAAVVSAMLKNGAFEAEVVCAGSNSARAARLAGQLASGGVEAVLSFGIAGALAPDLDCGDLIVAGGVRGPEGEGFPTDSDWRNAVTAALEAAALSYQEGAILGSRKTLRAAAEKTAAFAETGCLAADLESAAVAAAASAAGIPFMAVRAIADRAGDALPAFVDDAVKPDGRPALGRVLAALLNHPSDIAATLRLGRQAELALARLRMLAAAKEPLFGRF
jgi:hopanoid-associated phosphorylase